MKKKVIIYLAVFIILLTAPIFLFAESITINITAEVAYVDDWGNTLGGVVEVGDIITGEYTYESTTPDTNPLPTVGDYWHTTSPYGISLEVNGLVFETDHSDVEFIVEICNNHGTLQDDNYLLRSYNNLQLPGGIIVEHIAWQLDDPTGTALSSEALPIDPPILEDWQSIFGISINGFIPDPYFPDFPLFETEYFIRAHVTSATIVSPKIDVDIDIKPGSYPNCFNNNGHDVLPVAILGKPDFSVYNIDPATIQIETLSVKKVGKNEKLLAHYEDINDDLVDDLVVQIDGSEKLFENGEIHATLTGELYDGTLIEGEDTICIVP
ncbi:MAG: hypothetical protein ACMUIU_06570 [bacterium]